MTPAPAKPSRLHRLFHPNSIRSQLALGLAIGLVPCLSLGFFTIRTLLRDSLVQRVESHLESQGELIAFGLRNWGQGVSQEVQSLTLAPVMRRRNLAGIQSTFELLQISDPDRFWRYWSASKQPKLLAWTGPLSAKQHKEAEANQLSRPYFQAALLGQSSYQVVMSKTTGRGCLNIAQPVFRRPGAIAQRKLLQASHSVADFDASKIKEKDLSGVLVLCIPLNHLSDDTGLGRLFDDRRLRLLSSKQKENLLVAPASVDSAVVLVSNTGQLLFPNVDDGAGSRIPTIADLLHTQWRSLYPYALQAQQGKELFSEISSGGEKYFVMTSHVDSAWSLILVLQQSKVLSELNQIASVMTIVGLLTLLISLLIVYQRSASICRPLTKAGVALNQISHGDFDITLATSRKDELGQLLSNIQATADRLGLFVKESLGFAVTQKQLETAKSIQKDFLLSTLPVSRSYEVATITRPALEIGADWYDFVDTAGYIFLVVADVCDKGVPSALYMSVFRSLIRSSLLDSTEQLLDAGSTGSLDAEAASCIDAAITKTNQYMASNHNESMMFATLFIAAVNKKSGYISYISAGHEPPIRLHEGTTEVFKSVGGPAIGLFPQAEYSVSNCVLQPGESLVVFTDGLLDMRSPDEQPFGLERVKQALSRTPAASADDLMGSLVGDLDQHMSGTDQFDDLTIMIFKWLGPSDSKS